jgi:hypothetical protein
MCCVIIFGNGALREIAQKRDEIGSHKLLPWIHVYTENEMNR